MKLERGLQNALKGFTTMEQKFIDEVAKKLATEAQYPIDCITKILLKKPIENSRTKYYRNNEVIFYINPIIYHERSSLRYRPETEVTILWQDPTLVYSDDGRTMEFMVGVEKRLEDYKLELFGGFWIPLEHPLKNKDTLILTVLGKAFEQNTHTDFKFLTLLGLEEALQCYGFSILLSPSKYEITLSPLNGKEYTYEHDKEFRRAFPIYTLLVDAHTLSITSVTKFDPAFYPLQWQNQPQHIL